MTEEQNQSQQQMVPIQGQSQQMQTAQPQVVYVQQQQQPYVAQTGAKSMGQQFTGVMEGMGVQGFNTDKGACYFEGCPHQAKYTCQAKICCKQYGCWRVMCDEHKGKGCLSKTGRGPQPYLCVDHIAKGKKCTMIMLIVFLSIFVLVAIAALVVATTVGGGDSCTSYGRKKCTRSYTSYYSYDD